MKISLFSELTTLSAAFLSILLLAPANSLATPYAISGNLHGTDDVEVYGTLSINNSFPSSTIENAWANYLSTPTLDTFLLILDYQITSFDLYRTDTGENFFQGTGGVIQVVATGHANDTRPEVGGYNAWGLQAADPRFSIYSPRDPGEVVFFNNGIEVSNYDYDQLPYMIQLKSGYTFDNQYSANLTLTTAQPVPEPATFFLVSIGILLVIRKSKNTSLRSNFPSPI